VHVDNDVFVLAESHSAGVYGTARREYKIATKKFSVETNLNL